MEERELMVSLSMIDVSIICPTAKTYVKADGRPEVRHKLGRQKIEKYDKEVKKHGMDFIPFVEGKAKRLIDQLMDEALANNATSFVPDRVDLFIKMAVAVAVQIGNGMVAQEDIRRARGRKGEVSEVRGQVKKEAKGRAAVGAGSD